jgi:hypothetical protein
VTLDTLAAADAAVPARFTERALDFGTQQPRPHLFEQRAIGGDEVGSRA